MEQEKDGRGEVAPFSVEVRKDASMFPLSLEGERIRERG